MLSKHTMKAVGEQIAHVSAGSGHGECQLPNITVNARNLDNWNEGVRVKALYDLREQADRQIENVFHEIALSSLQFVETNMGVSPFMCTAPSPNIEKRIPHEEILRGVYTIHNCQQLYSWCESIIPVLNPLRLENNAVSFLYTIVSDVYNYSTSSQSVNVAAYAASHTEGFGDFFQGLDVNKISNRGDTPATVYYETGVAILLALEQSKIMPVPELRFYCIAPGVRLLNVVYAMSYNSHDASLGSSNRYLLLECTSHEVRNLIDDHAGDEELLREIHLAQELFASSSRLKTCVDRYTNQTNFFDNVDRRTRLLLTSRNKDADHSKSPFASLQTDIVTFLKGVTSFYGDIGLEPVSKIRMFCGSIPEYWVPFSLDYFSPNPSLLSITRQFDHNLPFSYAVVQAVVRAVVCKQLYRIGDATPLPMWSPCYIVPNSGEVICVSQVEAGVHTKWYNSNKRSVEGGMDDQRVWMDVCNSVMAPYIRTRGDVGGRTVRKNDLHCLDKRDGQTLAAFEHAIFVSTKYMSAQSLMLQRHLSTVGPYVPLSGGIVIFKTPPPKHKKHVLVPSKTSELHGREEHIQTPTTNTESGVSVTLLTPHKDTGLLEMEQTALENTGQYLGLFDLNVCQMWKISDDSLIYIYSANKDFATYYDLMFRNSKLNPLVNRMAIVSGITSPEETVRRSTVNMLMQCVGDSPVGLELRSKSQQLLLDYMKEFSDQEDGEGAMVLN
uniref:ORF25 n=1 Tax=Malaco herpesvirus 4 TaxID=3031800 RepID=A0AA48P7N4_9VIRU|nr:TPA_asm: ORF25 [Malaco herpesvirus 4]